MEYYIARGDDIKGPYSIDGLKSVDIRHDTLVWCEGLNEYTEAKYITSLDIFFNPNSKIEVAGEVTPELNKNPIVQCNSCGKVLMVPPNLLQSEYLKCMACGSQFINPFFENNVNKQNPPKNNNFYILVGIFILICIILVLYGINRNNEMAQQENLQRQLNEQRYNADMDKVARRPATLR